MVIANTKQRSEKLEEMGEGTNQETPMLWLRKKGPEEEDMKKRSFS